MGLRVIFLALLLLGAGFLGFRLGEKKPQDATQVRTEVRPTRNVVLAVKKLARLEGASFQLQRVIDLREKQSHLFGLLEAEDAILLVATGEVVAGVDLTQLSPKDVVVDERTNTVHIVLPLAEVFSSHLDNERTYVHTRSTDALAQRQTHLESRARQEAEREFEKAATDGGILLQAETQVALTVKALLSSLGFDVVQVSFRQVSSSEK